MESGTIVLIEAGLVLGLAIDWGVWEIIKTRREIARDRAAAAAREQETG